MIYSFHIHYFSGMKVTSLLISLFILTLIGCKESKNESHSLNGVDWQFSQNTNPKENHISKWLPATVPGSIQTDLLRLGKIPDPFKLNNEDSIQWVSQKNWIYKKSFSVPKKTLEKNNHILQFEGLDTYASIFLNDSLILQTNNAFRTWEINISWAILPENELRIHFQSPDTIEKTAAQKLNYTLPEAPRVFTRKPQFQYGWDWGPKIKTMGIWRDISLISYQTTRIKDAFIKTGHLSSSEAQLVAQLELSTISEEEDISVQVHNKTTGEVVEKAFTVFPSEKKYAIPFSIKNPKLWWVHNLGDPFLYEFEISLLKGKTKIDTRTQKVGVRTIELVTKKDSIGEGFYFKLNGKPVYMKGANYIPQNIFLADVQPQDREQLLNNVVDANMNMLRVWGGGVYEDNLFYDLCDEKGILVWQDFMFACAMYPGDEAFLNTVKAEAIDNVKRLRQHPSIALYCGNNENSEGWHRWGWQAGKTEAQKEEIWRNYQKVFNDILPRVVDSLSPSISYWESSPKYGRGNPRYQFEGDAHDWWVWHDGYPFEHFEEEVPRFMSEFGFQSFPSYEAIRYFTEQDSIDLSHLSFATHQKHSRGFSLIKQYMKRDFPVPNTAQDYVYVSQLVQAYGITKGIHAHRRAKPYNMGTLYWQLNDCWPVVSWSSIDGLGNWKALHYKAKKAFDNRLILAWEEEETLQITIVDDHLETTTNTLQITIKDFEGKLIKEQKVYNVSTNIHKNEVVYKMVLSDFEFEPKYSFAEITFGNKKSRYYFEPPKNLNLPKEDIEITEPYVTENGWKITVSSKSLQKDVFLYSDTYGHFSDNYFDLLPGESKTIFFFPKTQKPVKIKFKTLNGITL